jgi:hypothetical protein
VSQGEHIPLLRVRYAPASHNIGVAAEHLGKAANHHVGVREHLNVHKVAHSLVNNDEEVVFVGKNPQARQVGRLQEGIRREFSKQRGNGWSSRITLKLFLQKFLELINISIAQEMTARAPFFKDFQCVCVRKSTQI